MNYAKRLLTLAVLVVSGIAAAPAGTAAQGLFDPVITVNDSVITRYELKQRTRLLSVLNAPGDPAKLAREQLIEERLKMGAAEQSGLELSEEGVQAGLKEFAGRGNMEPDEFIAAMKREGVAEQTVRDFVTVGVTWRQLIAARFGPRVEITEADVDKALNAVTGGSSVRVLLSEIIMPAPPQQADEVQARAAQLSQINSVAEFSDAARKYSAAETGRNGGRLDWMSITKLPPALRPLILSLAPGQVTDPVPLDGAVALFQMRDIQETSVKSPNYAAIDYASYLIPGGRTEDTLQQAASITARIDTCDDLYGVAKGQPPERLTRDARKPGEIPNDIAVELSKLDPGEVSTTLTRTSGDGQALMLLMLCGRTPVSEEDASREEIKQRLRSDRLESFAASYLEQLRADARIVEK
ncbi:MAG: peptidylprolyl isomerase [Sediminimonas qiaohouensis]|uniref:Parvulin-like PPIase n=1 Tax=Sediminimonas qiaohouensis TaxID=552061 RepID=A0A7C9HBU5_9RHOB|nr:peptidylprolyl isomerase [Sediminimonas qiaohouensis]MTJ04287.1 peptidylprolyl isomerase [Sediminimonas qiaohouensis]